MSFPESLKHEFYYVPLWIHYSQLLFRIYQSTQPGGQHFLTVLNSNGSWVAQFSCFFSASRNACTIKWFRTKRKSGQEITEIFGAKVMLRNWYEWPKVLCRLWQNPKLGKMVKRRKRAKTEWKLPAPGGWFEDEKCGTLMIMPGAGPDPRQLASDKVWEISA